MTASEKSEYLGSIQCHTGATSYPLTMTNSTHLHQFSIGAQQTTKYTALTYYTVLQVRTPQVLLRFLLRAPQIHSQDFDWTEFSSGGWRKINSTLIFVGRIQVLAVVRIAYSLPIRSHPKLLKVTHIPCHTAPYRNRELPAHQISLVLLISDLLFCDQPKKTLLLKDLCGYVRLIEIISQSKVKCVM